MSAPASPVARALPFLGPVLGLAGLALGLTADASDPRGLSFAVAALAAFGVRPSLLFGALALLGGLTTPAVAGPVTVLPLTLVGLVLAGLALGLLGRELDRHLDQFLTAQHRPLLMALAAFGLCLAYAMPDPWVQLAAADGSPLTFSALVGDPTTALRLHRAIPAVVPYTAPLGGLELLALTLAGIATFAGLASWALAHTLDRVLRTVTLATAGIAGLIALVAMGDLLFGSVTLDGPSLRQALTVKASASGPLLDLSVPASAELRLWSRPWVDGLRFIAAGLVVLATLVPEHDATATPPTPTREPVAWLPLALAAAAAALPFAQPPMALAAGVVLGLGALVAGRSGHPSDLAPRLGLALVLVLWIWGAVATPPWS